MSTLDLSPTICNFAGVDVEVNLDGIDRSSVLLGTPSSRQPLFWQYGHPHSALKGGLVKHLSPTFAMRNPEAFADVDELVAERNALAKRLRDDDTFQKRKREIANASNALKDYLYAVEPELKRLQERIKATKQVLYVHPY